MQYHDRYFIEFHIQMAGGLANNSHLAAAHETFVAQAKAFLRQDSVNAIVWDLLVNRPDIFRHWMQHMRWALNCIIAASRLPGASELLQAAGNRLERPSQFRGTPDFNESAALPQLRPGFSLPPLNHVALRSPRQARSSTTTTCTTA